VNWFNSNKLQNNEEHNLKGKVTVGLTSVRVPPSLRCYLISSTTYSTFQKPCRKHTFFGSREIINIIKLMLYLQAGFVKLYCIPLTIPSSIGLLFWRRVHQWHTGAKHYFIIFTISPEPKKSTYVKVFGKHCNVMAENETKRNYLQKTF
jgi:hypothetical protein